MFLLHANNIDGLNNFLREKGWIKSGETIISATKPGDGNMNCVLRLRTTMGSYIIKQSRGYVEKYPQVAAPKERAKSEAAFYHCIHQYPFLRQHTPALLRTDKENNILLLEDLGTASDFTYLYEEGKTLSATDAALLSTFLNELHGSVIKNFDPLLVNRAMKELNHQHIFIYPFVKDNGFNLDTVTEGLQQISLQYKADKALAERATLLGNEYLAEGTHLLHGDYYPGSWLKTGSGIKVIDPEFCFFGKAEFDVGVMLAHCYLSAQPQSVTDIIVASYKKSDDFSEQLLRQFTGIEIMRRILGLAQLPLTATLTEKTALLQKSYALIMS